MNKTNKIYFIFAFLLNRNMVRKILKSEFSDAHVSFINETRNEVGQTFGKFMVVFLFYNFIVSHLIVYFSMLFFEWSFGWILKRAFGPLVFYFQHPMYISVRRIEK